MADGVKIDLKEFIAFSDAIGDVSTIERIYNNAFENMLEKLATISKKPSGHSFESRTHKLVNGILTEFKGNVGSVFIPEELVPYAKFVYDGTQPHVISVKNKKMLSNGQSFFGKKVLHPGYKGDPFILNNWFQFADKLTEEFLMEFVNKFSTYFKKRLA